MPRTTQIELPGCPQFRALTCDSLGLIKVVEAEGECGIPKVVARWGEPDLHHGIRCLSLSGDASPRLAIARKTNIVQILDPDSGVLQSELAVPHESSDTPGRTGRDGSDEVCGLHLFSNCSSWGRSVLTCTEYGDAALQRLSHLDQGEQGQVSVSHVDEDLLIVKWNISQTGNVLCMTVDGSEQHAVFGGKGVDVSLWDVEKKTKLWSGKPPHRDNLGLIPPPWVTAVTFLNNQDHRKIVIGTGQHQVRLYDVGAQRRAVLAFDYGESPIKTVTEDPDGNSVYVGTGSGDLGCFDMRTGKLVGGFKGKCAGSIRAVVRHPTLPLIASCGLDRYLRIHNTKTRQLLGLLYLKQQLACVVFDPTTMMSTQASIMKSERPPIFAEYKVEEEVPNKVVKNAGRNSPKRKKPRTDPDLLTQDGESEVPKDSVRPALKRKKVKTLENKWKEAREAKRQTALV